MSTSPSSLRTPQWPWSVYSHMHRSAMTTSSSPSFRAPLRPLMACWTTPSSEYASEPTESFFFGTPNTRTEDTPLSRMSFVMDSYPESGYVGTPGMESVYFTSSMLASKNTGRMSSEGSSRVSRTSDLISGVCLSLLPLFIGNISLTPSPYRYVLLSGRTASPPPRRSRNPRPGRPF